jgi:hypothetical protein
MRFRWTILGLGLSACLTGTSAYADSHGRPPVATPHAQAPKTTGKPTTTTSGSTSTSTSTSASAPLDPIAAKISSKPQLKAKINTLLASTGLSLNDASKGFKNQGLFIAALHVNQNLDCSCFKQLQTDMTTKGMSLGQAIQDVKKTANATVEAERAETEANDDVRSTTTTATSSSTAKNNKKKTTPTGSDQ